MINAVIKVEKLKADDKFFNETGIEEADVEPSIKRLKRQTQAHSSQRFKSKRRRRKRLRRSYINSRRYLSFLLIILEY